MSSAPKITIGKNLFEQLINSKKSLYLKSKNIIVTLNSEFFNTNLSNSTSLQANVAPITSKQLDIIQSQLSKTEGLSIVGDTSHTVTLDIKDNTPLDTFAEPLTLNINLKNTTFTDSAQLTLVRYSQQPDGTYEITKIGGTYNPNDQTLSGYVNKPGIYGIITSANLTKINLAIDNNSVIINQLEVNNDIAPQIIDGTTMVPLRFISEQFGITPKWNASTKTILLNTDSKELTLTIGKAISDDGIAPIIKQGRTLVPLRYISESLGAHVLWIPSTKSIEIVK